MEVLGPDLIVTVHAHAAAALTAGAVTDGQEISWLGVLSAARAAAPTPSR
jgi:hypothetical protein